MLIVVATRALPERFLTLVVLVAERDIVFAPITPEREITVLFPEPRIFVFV